MIRGHRIGLPHLVRKRHANGVEPVLLDFVENENVVLGPKAARRRGASFSSVPVHTADHEGRAGWINDLSSASVPSGGVERK